jgi:NAD+ kinase
MMPEKMRIHFIFDPDKNPDAPFARELIGELGQASPENARHFVTIGGDGMLMHTLHRAKGRKVAAIVPPGSNSVGFWTNKGIKNAKDIMDLLHNSTDYPIHPLMAKIRFSDGSAVIRRAFNDISIRPVFQQPDDELRERYHLSDSDVSVQSALIHLSVSFGKAVLGPARIMGSGIILATPMGSTAMNRSFGGPSIDIRNESIILTGIGTSSPAGGFNPVVNPASAVFDVEIQSQHKRPVIVSHDSFGTVTKNGSPIDHVKVSTDKRTTVRLILKDDPGLRAYSAIMK